MVALTRERQRKHENLAEILKALAHPTRLGIIAALCEDDAHVGALALHLGVPQALVSQQLRILRMRRLVSKRTEQGKAVYSLREQRLRQLISCLEGCRTDLP